MARAQDRAKRKVSGGVYQRPTKKLSRLARTPAYTKLGERKVKIVRERSGIKKILLLSMNKVNVYDQKTKKYQITDIKTVVDNPANRHFIRRNIITRGTIVETPLGKVKITSRPGQVGTLNGILI